jgi:4-alpha-glucanotransferase
MNLLAKRGSGILLHPTSLPGPFGIGDLGPSAFMWIDALARARQTWWQILPLGPTGYGDSPYQCFSAFAGNVYLISPEYLVRDGLLSTLDISGHLFSDERVDFGSVIPFKMKLLRRAWENLRAGQVPGLREPFEIFCAVQRAWLDDFAFFMALKESQRGESWTKWPRELMRVGGDSKLLERTRTDFADAIRLHQFGQFLFFRQWQAVRNYAHERGIHIIGDAPIFVSSDSADVWGSPEQFLLDSAMQPKVVAGVPPDYFSATGQLWGNPLYDWEAMGATNYEWWVRRMRTTLSTVDLVRLDHFRGFCAAWHIPYGEATAVKGQWVEGPGAGFIAHLQKELNGLPLIAEDLGEITPDVYEVRDQFDLPGMKVLQFAFDGPDNLFLPHNYKHRNCIVYTGTHDNDTTRGWFAQAPGNERWYLGRYLMKDGRDIAWDLIRLAWNSSAVLAIAPLQDVLDLGTEARMNLPGRPDGNWQWRFRMESFNDHVINWLADLTELFGRVAKTKQ